MPMNSLLTYSKARTQITKKEKIGQLFMPAAFINDTEEEVQALEQLIEEYHVGGLCFFHSRASAATNYEGKKEVIYNEQSFQTLQKLVKRYQKKSKYRLLIAIDAEWGLAMRIENTPQYPYAITLGALQDNLDLVYQVAKNIAHDCKQAGIHYNLAPVVDINNNPDNPVIGYRSFGENKFNVTEKSMEFVKGTQSEGVACSIKHFPGHGDTAVDSHLGLPVITKSKEELFENELYPFKQLIQHGVESVMVGHLSVPSLSNGEHISSSISKDIIKGLLRNELGHKGVVISDALNMHAVSKHYPNKGELEWEAFDAGNDILCFAEHIAAGIEMILDRANDVQLEESFKRVWKLKEKVIDAEVEHPTGLINPNKLNELIAKASITLVQGSKESFEDYRKNRFVGITNNPEINGPFFRKINESIAFSSYSISAAFSSSIKEEIAEEENIIISLFPPQIKPTNNFGFTMAEIQIINELISSKNVVIYLFGNPYALRVFDYQNSLAVVLAYQDDIAFQKVAAGHFLGRLPAKGKLPVAL